MGPEVPTQISGLQRLGRGVDRLQGISQAPCDTSYW